MAQVDKLALTRQEVAESLGVSSETVKRLLMSGELESFYIGSRRLVSVAALQEFIERRQRAPRPLAAG